MIWKYELPAPGEFRLEMPANPSHLGVQVQRGLPVLWSMVNPDAPKRWYGFVLIPTGEEFGRHDTLAYLGTVQTHDQELVWHLFQIT